MTDLYHGVALYIWIGLTFAGASLLVAIMIWLFGNTWVFRLWNWVQGKKDAPPISVTSTSRGDQNTNITGSQTIHGNVGNTYQTNNTIVNSHFDLSDTVLMADKRILRKWLDECNGIKEIVATYGRAEARIATLSDPQEIDDALYSRGFEKGEISRHLTRMQQGNEKPEHQRHAHIVDLVSKMDSLSLINGENGLDAIKHVISELNGAIAFTPITSEQVKQAWYHRSLELLDQETEIRRFPEQRKLLQNLSVTLMEISRRKRQLARPDWGNEAERANTQRNLDAKEKEKFDITMDLSNPAAKFVHQKHEGLRRCLNHLIDEPELEACKSLITQYDSVRNDFIQNIRQLRHDKPLDLPMDERLAKYLE